MREDALVALPEEEWELQPEASWPPDGASLIAEGVIFGEARPAGSKDVFVPTNPKTGEPYRGKHGQIVRRVTDSSGKEGETWRGTIRAALMRALAGHEVPFDEPLAISLCFYFPRNAGDFGTGRNEGKLKESAPLYPHTKGYDSVKLARAFEDAANKLIWRDDRRFVRHLIYRDFGPPRVEWRLYRLPKRVGHVAPIEMEQLPV